MALSEDQVKNAVIPVLAKLGYLPTKLKTITEHGVDIIARHAKYPRYFLVEAKGDSSKEAKYPGSGREVRFLQSVGQLVTHIQPSRGYLYGLAYPSSYRSVVTRRLHPVLLKTLQIHLFFVDTKLRVEHLTWRDLKANAVTTKD